LPIRAVVFDLFDTLVDLRWEKLPATEHRGKRLPATAPLLHGHVARHAEVDFDTFLETLFEGDRAFAVLRRASEMLAAGHPKEGRPPALMMSLHIWALAHGIASLFGRGDDARRKLPMMPEDLLEAAVLIYLDGLGLGGK